jgi:uncharacterized protein (TIGR03000 family)
MDRLKLWAGCALVAFGLLATARPVHGQTTYIPGNKFDYLINGMRSPTYSSPRYNSGYYREAGNSDYYSGYYATRPEYVVPANAALIKMQVPANAEVWLSEEKTQQTGAARSFVTPALEPGHKYAYQVKVRWMNEKGEKVERDRKVAVQPGARLNLRFE